MKQQFNFDVLFVGAGPANLSAAIHLTNLIKKHNLDISSGKKAGTIISYDNKIAILDKGAYFGSHAISGAILDPIALNEFIPDHLKQGLPIEGIIEQEEIHFLTKTKKLKIPFIPSFLENRGHYIISLTKVVQWLTKTAEANDVVLLKEVAAVEILKDSNQISGVKTDDRIKDKKTGEFRYPGSTLQSKVTVLGEGSAGYLTRKTIKELNLDQNCDPAIYELGVKEIYEIKEGAFPKGKCAHFMGYPLTNKKSGGAFLYGMDKNKVAIGLIAHLGSPDPLLDVHAELQRFKQHPHIKKILEGGKTISYGAKTLPCGGYYSIPKLTYPGLMLVGDGANFVDSKKLKGIHTAMKSGITAAEVLFEAFLKNDFSQIHEYETRLRDTWIFKDLWKSRNFTPTIEMGVPFPGGALLGAQLLMNGANPTGKFNIVPDYLKTKPVKEFYKRRKLPPALHPDDKLIMDKLTDVYLSRATHDEHQDSHITLKDSSKCQECKKTFDEPCTKFCPAKVYENVENQLLINFSNCLHCKTCDLKCPMDNINWRLPEAGGGPQYTCQ